MTPKRLLLFDIDGTMLSCRGRGLQAMSLAIQRVYGLPPAIQSVQPQGKTDPMLFEEMGAAYGLTPEALGARHPVLQDTYVAALEDSLREPGACESKPGVPALLDGLLGRDDVVLGIVSGNLERTAWLKLAAVGLRGYFGGGAFGSDARRRADLVRLAWTRFAAREGDFEPWRVWVIGDTPDDVAGGREHGVRTLAVATGGFTRQQLQSSAPDSLLDDFTDTARVLDILCSEG